MIKRRWILPIALAVATSITVVAAAANTVNKDADFKPEFAEKREQILSEKLEEGVISQEKYDEIMEAIESGEFKGPCGRKGFAGRWNSENAGEWTGEWTEEQKAEWLDKMKDIFSDKLENGEISQEEYYQIMEAIESGEFGGPWARKGFGRFWNKDNNSEESKDDKEAGWKNHSGYRGFRGFRGRPDCFKEQSE